MARLGGNRSGGPRRTAVTRTPYWCADGNTNGKPVVSLGSDGKSIEGEWRYLPTGATHRQRVETIDPETGKAMYEEGQYEAKGWTPAHRMEKGDARLTLLPENNQEMMRDHKATPKFRKVDTKVKADA